MSISDEQRTKEESLEPNIEELKLLRGLRKNPMLAGQIQVMVRRFEQEVADGMDADEAEVSLINSLQELGVTMMSQWVQNTQEAALEKALHDDPTLNKHSNPTFAIRGDLGPGSLNLRSFRQKVFTTGAGALT